ncbi:MAG: hypothetical protein GY940_01455 [bacterium]|nr:hypothetical protein [bacterium]
MSPGQAAVKPVHGFGKVPLYFIPNHGQVDQAVRFYAQTPDYNLWVTDNELVFDTARLSFLNANKNTKIIPIKETNHRVNYFKGKNPAQWQRNIPTSKAVLFKNIYDNIDLKIYGNQNQIEYDWIIKPGGNPNDIMFKYLRIKETAIDANGNLVVRKKQKKTSEKETAPGRFLHQKPFTYQKINGKQVEVESRFNRIGGKKNTYGFRVGDYDKTVNLVIDPYVVYYSTYLGGSGFDDGQKIAVDSGGNAYIFGTTGSTDFSTENAFQGSIGGGKTDVYVSKFSATGDSLLYSTYLGGNDSERAKGITVDALGNVYIVGDVKSKDFPTHVPYQGTFGGGEDAFVVKLSPTGDSLVYSTYLGGGTIDLGRSIAIDSKGNAYVAGLTFSVDFPTLNAYQDTHAGGHSDVYVTKLSPTGNSLVYSTFLGGKEVVDAPFGDFVSDIAVDADGCAYVAGFTYSRDFPSVNYYQYLFSGTTCGYVTKFSASGDSLVYSTYLGGNDLDFPTAVAVDDSGCAYVAGYTYSDNYPVINAYQETFAGIVSPFVTKFSTTGKTLEYSTFLGGTTAEDMALDANGCVYVTGIAWSTGFTTLNPFQPNHGGGKEDAYFTKLSATGDSLVYASYLGGNDYDDGNGIAIDGKGRVYITGNTESTDFPLSNSIKGTLDNDYGKDAFVTKLLFTDTQTYQLKVQSTGSANVPVTVTPSDYLGEKNGSTNFSRAYASGVTVTLTAPAVHNRATFLKWTVQGSEFTTGSIDITMAEAHTAVAVYRSPAKLSLDRDSLNFGAIFNGTDTGTQQFSIRNEGDADLNWRISGNGTWMHFSPSSGTNDAVVTVSIYTGGLTPGNYTGEITVKGIDDSVSSQTISLTLTVFEEGSSSTPFGTFETPTPGSTISSSVPFTGWVLDDVGVEKVQIFNDNTYIGDAVLVEGARPDVEQAYPKYPSNYKAGWGYMMLTNFLPNGGNGAYTFYAKAVDKEGNTVTLGSKTVTIDNANAVKPFGAIDTPTQGGSASGDKFVNWGWVLTPQPNSIPTDGSTISVWVDGVSIGHPVYNIYRSDIAGLFPDYSNSNGAIGYFYLDTTAYGNGVHTIQWTAADNAGNTDGIGSRYFTVANTGQDSGAAVSRVLGVKAPGFKESDISRAIVNPNVPVRVTKGYKKNGKYRAHYPDDSGSLTIEIKELERLAVQLGNRKNSPARYSGYLLVGNRLKRLPIGSFLDTERGLFSWQLGVGFVGEYRLVFIEEDSHGNLLRRNITIKINPKY